MHLELVTATATAPSTGAAGAAVTGDSLIVKNGKNPRIVQAWADLQSAGAVQIVRPSGHDTTRDFRARVPASEVEMILPLGVALDCEAQETLGITIIGSATAGDVEQLCMLFAYDDLPGSKQNLITWRQLQSRIVKLLTLEFTITASAGPGYSGEELVTAESDLLKANTEYAIIGGRASVEGGCLYVKGPDTANAKIGFPANDLDAVQTAAFFAELARAFDAPMIPVFNSGNKGSTYIGCHQDENGTAIPGHLILAMLK